MPTLLEHIQPSDFKPEVIITRHIALEDAARGYEIFEKVEKVEKECRKVMLTPGGLFASTLVNQIPTSTRTYP